MKLKNEVIMANRYFSGVQALNKEVKILTGTFTTAGTGAAVLDAGLGIEVLRTGVGVFTVRPISYDKGSVKYDTYPAILGFMCSGVEPVTTTFVSSTSIGTVTVTSGETTGKVFSFVMMAQNSSTPSV